MDEAASEDELARRALAGSRAALEALYERFRAPILGYAFRMTGDRSIAEDVFQETFLYFFQHLDRYEPRGRLGAYLFRIARSLALDALEAARREREETGNRPPEGPSEEGEGREGLAARAQAALLGLAPHLREVAVLRLYEGMDYAKIGEVAGISEATARSRMRYALEALRAALGAPPPEENA